MMTAPNQKMADYLEEAYVTERRLARELERRIEIAPAGPYRQDLVRHLRERRDHAHHLHAEIRRRGRGGVSLRRLALGIVKTGRDVVTAPFRIGRGAAPAEEVLGTAKAACAEESRQIAHYTAIEQLARRIGDEPIVALAVSIRTQEQEMLSCIAGHVGPLTDAVVAADVDVDANHRAGKGADLVQPR